MSAVAAGDIEIPRPDGVVLRGRCWDPPPGRATIGRLVIVHGLGDHGGRYDDLVGALGEAGWRVVAVDQRGHGRSPGRPGVLRDVGVLVDDVAAVGDWVCGHVDAPGAPVVFGHSMGGLVALRVLQTGPAGWAAGVLSAPWLATKLPVPGWKRLLEPVLARLLPDVTVSNGIRGEHLTRDPERVRAWRADPLVHDRASAGLAAAVADAQKAALAASVPSGVPVLVLLPGDDPVTDVAVAERWAEERGGEGVDVERLEDRRHEAHNDVDRARVFARLVAWLGALRGAEQGPRNGYLDRGPPRSATNFKGPR